MQYHESCYQIALVLMSANIHSATCKWVDEEEKMKVNGRGVFENDAYWEPSQVILHWCLSLKVGLLGPQPRVQPWSHIGRFCMEGPQQLRSAEK